MSKVLTSLLASMLLASSGLSETARSSPENLWDLMAAVKVDEESSSGKSSVNKIDGSVLLESLKSGGYIIYFRHATTEKDYADQADPLMRLDDCNSQRKLSIQGVRESYDIGIAFVSKKIPVGRIIVSEYCRSWKTANYAFGEWTQKDSRLNFLPYEDYTKDLVALMKKNVTPLLTQTPLSGTNTVIIGHDDIFEAATGIYPKPQGIAYILRPDGKGAFEIIANLLPSEWADL